MKNLFEENLVEYIQNQYKKPIKQLEKECEYLKKIKKIKLVLNHHTEFGENIYIMGNITNNELKKCDYDKNDKDKWVYLHEFKNDIQLNYKYIKEWNDKKKNYQIEEKNQIIDIRNIAEYIINDKMKLIDDIVIKNDFKNFDYNKNRYEGNSENKEIKNEVKLEKTNNEDMIIEKIKFQINNNNNEGEIFINGKMFDDWKKPEKLEKRDNNLEYIYNIKKDENLYENKEYKYMIEWKNGLLTNFEKLNVRILNLNDIKNKIKNKDNNFEYNNEEKMIIIKDNPEFNYKEGAIYKKLEIKDIKKIRVYLKDIKIDGKDIYVNGNIFNNWKEPKKCELDNDSYYWEYEINNNVNEIVYKYLQIIDKEYNYEDIKENRLLNLSEIINNNNNISFDKNNSMLIIDKTNFIKIEMEINVILENNFNLFLEGNYQASVKKKIECNKINNNTWRVEFEKNWLKDNIFEYKFIKIFENQMIYEKDPNRKFDLKNFCNNEKQTFLIKDNILKIYETNLDFQ
jgi:hypothetical protein